MKSIFSHQHRELVRKLKAARLAAGLTQLQVAKKLKRPQSFIARLESGQRRIDVIELNVLAQLYERKIASFLSK